MSCTYTLTLPNGEVRTIIGKAAMKAFLVQEGMSLFYPNGFNPNASTLATPDLNTMFNDVLAEEIAKDEAKAQKQRASKAPAKPRTAAQATKSAAKNTAAALVNAIDGLGALFGQTPPADGTINLNSGIPVKIDAETYAKAKPLFQQAIANLGNAGSDLKEAMRAVVRMVLDKFGIQAARNMQPYVVQFIEDVQNERQATNGEQDVPSATDNLESDSSQPGTERTMVYPVQGDAGAVPGNAGSSGGPANREAGSGQPGGTGLSAGGAAASGERGDFGVYRGDPAAVAARVATGADFSERGSDVGFDGVRNDPIPAAEVDRVAVTSNDRLTKERLQRQADAIPIKPGDLENVRTTLPYLLEGQQEDVAKAETRFAKPDGYGMLFTNGTGTGKTFTGLGVIKRMVRQGKDSILVVVPDEKIMDDWRDSGKALGLSIAPLADTKDAGKGLVVTTYANLGQNDALARRQWDMVVADEAHELMKSADGKVTTYLANLRAITHHPDGAYQRHTMLNRKDIDALREISSKIEGNIKILNNTDTMEAMVTSVRAENARLQKEADALAAKLREAMESVRAEVDSMQGDKRARLLSLSATPFAYEFTVDWANGYLFDYNEGQASDRTEFRGYNQGSNKDRFFMTHFGYSMRYNKLTKPDASKVDTGLLQRNFNTYLRKTGALSSRMLDVQADYDRRFVLVDSAIGNQIDDALNWISEKRREASRENMGFATLGDLINEKFDHLSRRYLLEAIKATEVVPIVRQHMALGRKVVVFHDYKKGGGFNPFDVKVPGNVAADATPEQAQAFNDFRAAVAEFRSQFRTLVNAPLGTLDSPIEVFKREFPDVLLVNGDEKKTALLDRYKKFQDDASGPQVMLVQSAKNKGWSGHDTTGKHQRVLINLGQPTAPTTAIQQEGRIYRTGQVTDAVMRYLNTGTTWEKIAFAQTIAGRASAAENLGMGEQARALKDSFIAAFEESDSFPPGHEGEGKGGKERDKLSNAALTAYDRAKTFYWTTQKKNSKTKAQEGKDYFATPEPVGYKMAEWLRLRGGESSLEPSAGHGAIARWLPENTNRTAIEPSNTLRARLAMAMDTSRDRLVDGTFEEHAIVNKYDGIAMNPPFGVGGKTAIEHLAKAANHLRDGGRIVALIPTGPTADKRFDQWMYGESERPAKPLYIDPNHGPIYKGDTLTLTGFGELRKIVVDKVDGRADGPRYVRDANTPPGSAINITAISKVESTGPRTETYRAAENLYMVGEVKLPSATFERAGTNVATRIVIIDKQIDSKRAPQETRNIDLSNAKDINELFNRLEEMTMPQRVMTREQQAQADAEKAQQAPAKPVTTPAKTPKAANPDAVGTVDRGDAEIIEHVTKKGKTLRGIVKTDLLREEAEKIDPYTFRKDGGWFIRQEYLKPEDSGASSPDVYRTSRFGGSAQPKLSQKAVEQAVAAATRGIPGNPVIKVFLTPESAGLDSPFSGIPKGATLNDGSVFIFSDAAQSRIDVFETVFHELFHRGSKVRFEKNIDYITTMLDIAASDPLVQQGVIKWKKSEDGIAKLDEFQEKGAMTGARLANYEALAVEEALAEMAEKVMAGAYRDPETTLQGIARFLANVMERWGMKDLARWLNTRTLAETERFVMETVLMAGGRSNQFTTAVIPGLSGGGLNSVSKITVFDWFGRLGSKSGNPRQGVLDAVSALNVPFNGRVVEDAELGPTTPAALNTANGDIHFNPIFKLTRAQWAQVMAEEVMHAVDVVGNDLSVTSTSSRLAGGGDIRGEVDKVFASGEGLAEFLSYPLDPNYRLSDARINAELFARLAVLYHGDQALMRRQLPISYEAFNDLFGSTLLGPESRVLRDVRAAGATRSGNRSSAQRQGSGVNGGAVSSNQVRGPDSGLDALRQAIADIFGARAGGGVISDRRIESNWQQQAGASPEAATWQAPSLEDKSHKFAWDNMTYALQDKLIDTKRVVQAIQDAGRELKDQTDVYLQEELYHARVSHKSQGFVQQELTPMVKALASKGIDLPDFETYLHARHAPEANRVMKERNPNEAEIEAKKKVVYAQLQALGSMLKDEGAPAKEKARVQRLFNQMAGKLELLAQVKPWTGSEEDRQKLSGMSDDEARAVMAKLTPEQARNMAEVAAMFDAIVKKNRQEMVDYDLEDQDTVDGWGQMFKFYVPLMREDDGNTQGTGQGFSIKGREVKSRTGSTRKVVDIVANLAMQRERLIVRGEKNRVSQALVGLASANPNPDFWKVGAPDMERKYDPRTNSVKLVTDPNYKNKDNVVTAKLRGADGKVQEVAVVFNEDDNRAKRMAESLKNLDGQTLEGLYAAAAPITRYLASMSTQYNPVFGVVNLARDLQGAAVNLAGTPLADKKGKIAWQAKNALVDIYRAARADRKNEAHTGEWTQWWDMFQEDGGPTGYRNVFQDSAERTKAITNTMDPDAWMESAFGKVVTVNGLLKDPMRVAEKGGGFVLDWLSDYNLAMENAIRVSTYRSAVESGMTRQRAASLAKNITVNFNRKGQVGLKMGALYAFFNAAVQGTARMGKALVTMEPGKPKTMRLSPLGKKVVYGGMLMGAIQAVALAAAGFDDENPPDFVRERNTIIPIGGGRFITIPMPLGLHVFPGIGRHLTEFALSGGKEPQKRAIAMLGMMADTFNPIGNAGMSMQTLLPTALDPLAALVENKDYAGRPIARTSMDPNVPGHELTRTTATWISQGVSELINWATGGDKYVAGVFSPTPDQIDYLVGQATGGVGRELLKLTQTGQALTTGEELPMHKVPLLGRFVGTANGSASQSGPFYAKVTEAKRLDRRIDGLREDGDTAKAMELQRSNSYLLAKARVADSQVTRLRREKRQLLEKGAPRAQVQEVERRMSEAMRRFNEATAN